MTTLTIPTERGCLVAPPCAARTACTHCGLPVPAGLIESGAAEQFCCAGCRTVHDILHRSGLGRFYAVRHRTGAAPRPARPSNGSFAGFDDPAYFAASCRAISPARCETEFYLEGVHCAACVWLVEKLPRLTPGVIEARLDLGRGMVHLAWDPRVIALSEIARRLDRLGYVPHPARGHAARERHRAEDRRRMVRIAVAGAIAGNVMVISFAMYGAMFHAMEQEFLSLFRWSTLGLATVSVAWPGREFFRGAWKALRARTVNMDLPIAIGLSAGLIAGAVNTVRGGGEVYFDSITVLILLLLSGRFLQTRRQRAGYEAVEAMLALTPSTARRIEGDGLREVPITSIARGDRLEVRAGDSFPADAVVREGASNIDRAILTGESRPVPAGVGDVVHAGTTNLGARLVVEVTETGESTRIGRLMRLVSESAHARPRLVRLADRVASVFVIVVLTIAAGTAGAWMLVDPSRALECSMALLIVTCPCALGMATPLAVVASLGQAARRGILIKGGDVIERLASPGLAVLDKTGTVTAGEMSLVSWHGDDSLKPIAAAVERHSAHPIARAMVMGLRAETSEPDDSVEVLAVTETTGRGMTAMVRTAAGEQAIRIGSRAFVTDQGAQPPALIDRVEHDLTIRAVSPVFIAVDGVVRAVAGVGDPIKPDAAAVVAELRRRGWRVAILSGDHPDVVRVVGASIGVEPGDSHGGVSPEDKAEWIREAAAQGPVMMIGDGVNDAAALAAATVGVAVKGGAEAALQAADVFIASRGLAPVVEMLDGAKRALRVIRRNVAASLGYNAIATALAVTGIINPLIAAIMMPISSLTVVTLSFRSRTFGGPPCQ